jgi:hypothetical protein
MESDQRRWWNRKQHQRDNTDSSGRQNRDGSKYKNWHQCMKDSSKDGGAAEADKRAAVLMMTSAAAARVGVRTAKDGRLLIEATEDSAED